MFWRNVLPPYSGFKYVNSGICKVIKASYSKGGHDTEGVVRMSSKKVLLRGTLVFHYRCEMELVRKDRHFLGHNIVFGKKDEILRKILS
jgi:hypothetical protein